MLTELEIQGFRCFPSLTAKPLGRVNLLVGKNNSGKTAFLDAVELLAWDGPGICLNSLLRRREYSERATEDAKTGNLMTEWVVFPAHLFSGYLLYPDIQWSIGSDNRHLSLSCSRQELPPFPPRLEIIVNRVPGREQSRVGDFLHLPLDSGGGFQLPESPSRLAALTTGSVHFLPTERMDVHAMSKKWDELQLSDDEQLVTESLRFLEPRVERIGFRGAGENRHVAVRLKGDKEPRRLGSLGDGMRHILALALHLVPAKDGYLLIDEIDTGLHYSVLAQMWRMVIESARRLNIQVFATTHSMDCIQALAEVHQQMKLTPEDLMLHRLVAGMDKTMSYTPDDLVAVAEFQGEVR